MTTFTAAVVGGISLGAVYSLITIGLVLCYRATETLNFAHGQFMLLAAFLVGKWQATTSAPIGQILVASLVIVGIVGALLYGLLLRRTVGRPHFIPVIATLGFAAVADGVMNLLFGSQQYLIKIPGLPTGSVELFGARFGAANLVITGLALALAGVIVVIIRATTLGIKIRAAGQDPLLASQGGINVQRIYLGSWAAAAMLGGIAGIAYGATNIVSTQMVDLALLAFPAMLLGGLDSIPGGFLGGMAVGLIQSFTATYWGGENVNAVTYVVLLVVMLVIPQGLLGTKKVLRV